MQLGFASTVLRFCFGLVEGVSNLQQHHLIGTSVEVCCNCNYDIGVFYAAVIASCCCCYWFWFIMQVGCIWCWLHTYLVAATVRAAVTVPLIVICYCFLVYRHQMFFLLDLLGIGFVFTSQCMKDIYLMRGIWCWCGIRIYHQVVYGYVASMIHGFCAAACDLRDESCWAFFQDWMCLEVAL